MVTEGLGIGRMVVADDEGGSRGRSASLDARIAPFALVAAIAELSVLLPPGPKDIHDLFWSLSLLVVTALALPVTWEWFPRWPVVIPPLAYMVAAYFLMLAVGGMGTAIVAVALIPVAWSALNLTRWMSAVVLGSMALTWLCVSIATNAPVATGTRLVVLWLAIGIVLCVGTHTLRTRLGRSLAVQHESARRAGALNDATQELSEATDADEVMQTAARLVAVLASPSGLGQRRGLFLQIDDGWVRTVAGYDEADGPLDRSWLLVDHPLLKAAYETGTVVGGRLGEPTVGPTLAPVVEEAKVTHGAWIPVLADGRTFGVLAVGGRGEAIPADLFEQCAAVGHVAGLALRNVLAQQELRQMATTDGLTGALNRRGLDQARGQREGEPFSVLTLDLDNLKKINDEFGHDTGDTALVAISRAASGVLRQGDTFARMGGDEFAAVLANADEDAARRVAERILKAVREINVAGIQLSVSIGISTVDAGTEFAEALRSADSAMYAAKRNGGMRYQFVESGPSAAA